jgi:hypothetical protein
MSAVKTIFSDVLIIYIWQKLYKIDGILLTSMNFFQYSYKRSFLINAIRKLEVRALDRMYKPPKRITLLLYFRPTSIKSSDCAAYLKYLFQKALLTRISIAKEQLKNNFRSSLLE